MEHKQSVKLKWIATGFAVGFLFRQFLPELNGLIKQLRSNFIDFPAKAIFRFSNTQSNYEQVQTLKTPGNASLGQYWVNLEVLHLTEIKQEIQVLVAGLFDNRDITSRSVIIVPQCHPYLEHIKKYAIDEQNTDVLVVDGECSHTIESGGYNTTFVVTEFELCQNYENTNDPNETLAQQTGFYSLTVKAYCTINQTNQPKTSWF